MKKDKSLEERYPKMFLLQAKIVDLLSDNIPRSKREIGDKLGFSRNYISDCIWNLLGSKIEMNGNGKFKLKEEGIE